MAKKKKDFDSYLKGLKKSPTGFEFIENANNLLDLIKDAYSLTGEPVTRAYLDNCYWNGVLRPTKTLEDSDLEDYTRFINLKKVASGGPVNPFTGEVPSSILIRQGSFYFDNPPFAYSDRFGRYMRYLEGTGKVERVSRTGYIPLD